MAESFGPNADRSTLAGAVVRADRVVDGLRFGRCTVGGTDATERIAALCPNRDDVPSLLVAGVALAWYNLVDLAALSDAVECPVVSVTFESSTGLERALRDAFEGDALDRRLAVYRRLPPRASMTVNGEELFVRGVGVEEGRVRDLVRAFTPEGGRPEPLRVARLAARAADGWRRAE